jgi:energy-coupling factor transporter ATP-binding protein EcfA2
MSSLPFSAFTADGFRGLRSLEVDELRGINVFVGGNNSGKTSVLETLSLLANPSRPLEWLQMVRRRDFGRLDESALTSLRWCFSQAGTFRRDEEGGNVDSSQLACQFTARGSHPIRKMVSQYSEQDALSDRIDGGAAERELDEAGALVRQGTITSRLEWAVKDALIGNDDSEAREHSAVSVTVADGSSSLWSSASSMPADGRSGPACAALLPYSYQLNSAQIVAHSSQLFQNDDDELLVDLMRQFDEDVIKVEIGSMAGRRAVIYVKHRRLGVVPLSVFGDAMRRCLLLASTLTGLGRGGILLLDEIEVGIHIDSLPKVFKWLVDAARQIGVQVFATTHSLEVLDALLAAEVTEEDLSVYRIKQGTERTECQHFPFDSLKRLRYERGLDIR